MKYLAAVLMFIDHVGMVLYPHDIVFRIIGRLAMPIFAYGIAMGFMHTSSLKKYVIRLFMFTVASQPFFALMQYSVYGRAMGINIGATFLIACICLGFITKRITTNNKVIDSVILIILLALADILHCDYGVYGVIVVLAFYRGIVSDNEKLGYMWFAFVTFIDSLMYIGGIQIFSILSIILLPYAKNKSKYMPRYFFYVFYPLHMLIIVLIKILFY